MPANCSIAEYAPDAVRGEAVNIGIFSCNRDAVEWCPFTKPNIAPARRLIIARRVHNATPIRSTDFFAVRRCGDAFVAGKNPVATAFLPRQMPSPWR